VATPIYISGYSTRLYIKSAERNNKKLLLSWQIFTPPCKLENRVFGIRDRSAASYIQLDKLITILLEVRCDS